jgi:hypothetical protein
VFLIAARRITRHRERLMLEFRHKLEHHADAEVSVVIPSPL